jgi:hypothetical protein
MRELEIQIGLIRLNKLAGSSKAISLYQRAARRRA